MYNGDYYKHGHWNGKPHWALPDNSAHLYYFSGLGESYDGYWQITTENQWFEYIPGGLDLYDGGYWQSNSNYNHEIDFDNKDIEIQGHSLTIHTELGTSDQ